MPVLRAGCSARDGRAPRQLLTALRAFDGEMDPRNLLLLLQLLRALLVRAERAAALGGSDALDVVVPDVLEALTCYFPISFVPPAGSEHSITAQHLLQALVRVLRASARFAPAVLKMLASKLRADDETADGLHAQALSMNDAMQCGHCFCTGSFRYRRERSSPEQRRE